MNTNADPWHSTRPSMTHDGVLNLNGCLQGVDGRLERDKERIAFSLDLKAVMQRPDFAQQLVVFRQKNLISLTELMEQPR